MFIPKRKIKLYLRKNGRRLIKKFAWVWLIAGLLFWLFARSIGTTNEPDLISPTPSPEPTPGKWITLPDGSQFRENICDQFETFETELEESDGTKTKVILCPVEKRNFEVNHPSPTPIIEPTASPKALYGPVSGKASYYSLEGCIGCRNDRKMANGEVLDDTRLTVAYNRAPLNSYLQITNVNTQKTVIAKVTDRGGFENHGKIVDLSVATKEALGCGDVCKVMILPYEEITKKNGDKIALFDNRP